MTPMRTFALAILSCLGLSVSDTPRFAPAEKSSVEKTIRSELEFAVNEFGMTMDGRELPKSMTEDVVLKFERKAKLVLTDRYVKSGAGRPLELDRTFDEITETKRDTQKMYCSIEPSFSLTSTTAFSGPGATGGGACTDWLPWNAA